MLWGADERRQGGLVNKSSMFDACESKLTWLCTRVLLRGKLNVLNLNLHCEDFYAELLNRIYSLNLINANALVQNVQGFDLLDPNAQVLIQVSATATKKKVNSALGKDLSQYKGHNFKFMSIAADASHLRQETFTNPHGLVFTPADDIYDVASVLEKILHMNLAEQREIYAFIKDELGEERHLEESNLATVINVISKENLAAVSPGATAVGFNVDEKVVFNGLNAASNVIEDYKVFHHVVDRIYDEFDSYGSNKSRSVLDAFRSVFNQLSSKYSGDDLFYQIVERIIDKVRESSNYSAVPVEELQLCVNILAVDAFIRCKIFKNPVGTQHAVT